MTSRTPIRREDVLALPIEPRLHLERAAPGELRFSRRTLKDGATLATTWCTYRASRRGVMRSKANPFARPMTIADVARRLSEYAPGNRAIFNAYIADYKSRQEPVRLNLPAYALSDDRVLILDGIHRCTALVVTGAPFAIDFLTIEGPLDRRLLVDLKYFDGGMRNLPSRLRRRFGALGQ